MLAAWGDLRHALTCLANRIAHLAAAESGTALRPAKLDERVAQVLRVNAGQPADLVTVARQSAAQAEGLLAMF